MSPALQSVDPQLKLFLLWCKTSCCPQHSTINVASSSESPLTMARPGLCGALWGVCGGEEVNVGWMDGWTRAGHWHGEAHATGARDMRHAMRWTLWVDGGSWWCVRLIARLAIELGGLRHADHDQTRWRTTPPLAATHPIAHPHSPPPSPTTPHRAAMPSCKSLVTMGALAVAAVCAK